MYEETIPYTIDGQEFIGQLIAPEKTDKKKKPGILVVHAWKGRDAFAIQKAKDLASLGYVAFAVDLYGGAKVVKTPEEALKLMLPLFLDRKLLQKRIRAAFDLLREHPLVDPKQIGGIGFCFGGLTLIELLRSGADVKGVVSFHALLGTKRDGQTAKTVPIAKEVKGALLLLHGHDDPLVTPEDLANIQDEMTKANVDWQLHTYGHASHAFTNPEAHDPKRGMMYNSTASLRAWKEMRQFLEEIFRA